MELKRELEQKRLGMNVGNGITFAAVLIKSIQIAKDNARNENAVQQHKNVPELLCYEEKLACKIVGVSSK
jgi:hypothetical protein